MKSITVRILPERSIINFWTGLSACQLRQMVGDLSLTRPLNLRG